jgi:HlyD family secretion protein
MKKILRRTIYTGLALALAIYVVIAFLPSPVKVEAVRVQQGHMMVAVEEDGEARVHDRYIIAAPITGRLERVEFDNGDAVKKGVMVASLLPAPVEPQKREEIFARVQNAQALQREADAQVEHARADYAQAQRERARAEELAQSGLVSLQTLEQARNAEATSRRDLDAARYRAAAAASDVRSAEAGLIAVEATQRSSPKSVKIYAPVSGKVLQVLEKSERVVPQGTPLITIGNPRKLEVVVDVLSSDAVKVTPGMKVLIEGWGGDHPLLARVRCLEAAAVTKISALGVEEQRVNVIADFIDSPDVLGDGYRVEVNIVTWEADKVLTVPLSALFRRGENWSVFIIEGDKVTSRNVEIGHRSRFAVEILKGLEDGEQIVLHPSNDLKDGMRIEIQRP